MKLRVSRDSRSDF